MLHWTVSSIINEREREREREREMERERDYEGQISKTNFWLEGVQGEWDTFYTPHLPERNERNIKIIIQIYIQIHQNQEILL